MPSICLYFQVHQPYRLRRYTVFDIGRDHYYEGENLNCDTLLSVAQHCYLPMNRIIADLIRRYDGRFKVAFSLTGTVLDQFEQWAPEVLHSFQELADTGCVEFLSETDAHSMAYLFSLDEFQEQVRLHDERILKLFGQRPAVFRNTELVYNNNLAKTVEDMGYKAILAEGADHILGWRTPNFAYQPTGCLDLKLLLNNRPLADAIARHFEDRRSPDWPLTAETVAKKVHAANDNGECVNLFMDYEAFGWRQSAESGVFDFMRALPEQVFTDPDFDFRTPSELADTLSPMARLDVPLNISWAEDVHDLTDWFGNDMQNDAVEAAFRLGRRVKALGDAGMLRTWRRLQTSDHFRYMSTKWFAEENVRPSDNPFGSPYDAYINYMNVLGDFELTLHVMEEQAEKNARESVAGGALEIRKPAAAAAAKQTDALPEAGVASTMQAGNASERNAATGKPDPEAEPAAQESDSAGAVPEQAENG